MKRVSAILFLLLLLLAGCSSAAPTAQTSDANLAYPLETKTGVEDIDPVLAAVASGSQEELRALIQYTEAPCTKVDGLGGPPKCEDGEMEGTVLEVLPYMGAEGSFLRKSGIDSWPGMNATALYAVYKVPENARREQYYLPGDYVALFLQQENQPGVALHITEGKIVRIDSIFSPNGSPNPFEGFIEQNTNNQEEVILAPKTR